MDDGRTVTIELFNELLPEEMDNIKDYIGEENYKKGRFQEAVEIFQNLITAKDFPEFLTLPAYKYI